ncbi:MAG: amidohydrolase [Verrucomicrobia bacterium]|nr:MAG: amidohydrolase [Verrucomicrobiota bacterium]
MLTIAQSRPFADVIVTHAKIWTGDKRTPAAEALAIIGDRIVGLGSAAEINAWRDRSTKVVDAGGRRVVPGFNDAHVHFVDGGRQLDNIDLRDAATPQEFSQRIGEWARHTARGEWILGGDWDDQRWNPPALPTKELIDTLTADTPVFVGRYDGHMALANSVALKLAGVTAATEDPPGGTVVKDRQGNPTGILKDAAMTFVTRVIPPMTHEQRIHAITRALEHARSVGVTSVQHMNPTNDDIAAYAELAARDALTTRIYAAPMETDWRDQAKLGIGRAFGSPMLRIGAVKGFADGSLGSGTAYFFEPYSDAPEKRGLLSDEMQPLDGMRQRLIGADKAGLQLCIHAIGDAAISQVLDLFSDVIRANGLRDRRLRIEHAQHMASKDFARFAEMNVIASVQPYHAIDDGRWAERRIGSERAKTTYAFRTFLDHGVHLALGTDWSVAPLNPMLTLYAATTRATLDGAHPDGWVPEQKISIEEALTAYTAGSAYAEFQEQEKGTLARGMLADLVVLSDDILAIAPERIKDVKVTLTMVGGKIVFTGK